MKFRIVNFLPALGWFLLSFYLLTLPGTSLPKIGWFNFIHGDKFVHIGMFGVLVLLFLLPFRKHINRRDLIRTALLIAVISLGYGTAMEYVQKYFIPNRSFDVGDIMADGIGSFIPVVWAAITRSNTVQ